MAIKYLDSKRIRGSSVGETKTPEVDENFEGDGAGSPTTWVNTDNTATVFNTTTNVLDWDAVRDGSNNSASFDLQQSSALDGSNAHATAWVLRFKFVIDNRTAGGGSSNKILVGLSSHDHATTYGSNQDSISFRASSDESGGTDTFTACDSNSNAMDANKVEFARDTSVGTYHVEIIRKTDTTATINIFDSTGYGTLLESEDFTPETGLDPLRYIVVKNRDSSPQSSPNGIFNGTIDDIKFYNGVTTATQDEKATLNPDPYTNSLGSAGDLDDGVFPAGASSVTTPTGLGDDYWVCLADRLDPVVQLCPISSDFTVAFWFYPTDSVTASQRFLSSGSGMHEMLIEQEGTGSGSLKVQITDVGSNVSRYVFPHGFSLNTWYLCVFTYDVSTGQIAGYVNNSAPTPTADLTAAGSITTTTVWRLLSVNTSQAEDVSGNLMEFAIWNKILTANERYDLYTGGSGGSGGTAGVGKLANTIAKSNLMAYYSGTDVTDPIANEATGNESDLPENTLFEETDTYNIYWLQSGKWEQTTASGSNVSWSDNQTTDRGWVSDDSDNYVDTTNNKIIIRGIDPLYISTGVEMLASENFVIDIEVNAITVPTGGRQDSLMLSSKEDHAYPDDPSSQNWFNFIKLSDSGSVIKLGADNGSLNEVDSNIIALPTANTWYWYRFTRNGTTCTSSRYTSSANRDSNTSATTATTTSMPTTWTDSKIMKYFNFGGYSSDPNIDVRNIVFYRGVTSV